MMYLFLFDWGNSVDGFFEEGDIFLSSKASDGEEPKENHKKAVAGWMDQPVSICVRRGVQISGQIDFLINDSGIFLYDDSDQYHIPFENIEHVFIDSTRKAHEKPSFFRKMFTKDSQEMVYHVVLSYRNPGKKLKVLTLEFPGSCSNAVEKLKKT